MGVVSELRRRNVFRMAVLYMISAWLVMQVAEVIIGLAGLPEPIREDAPEWPTARLPVLGVPAMSIMLMIIGVPTALVGLPLIATARLLRAAGYLLP